MKKRTRSSRPPCVTCACGCKHNKWNESSSLEEDADDLIEQLGAVNVDDLFDVVSTPDRGWTLRAKQAIRAGQLLGLAECNIKIEREDSLSSSFRYEVVGRFSDDIVRLPPRANMSASWDRPVLVPIADQILRYANLPDLPPSMMMASPETVQSYIDENHNATILTILDWPCFAAVACRRMCKGELVRMHYGPDSHEVAIRALEHRRSD